MKQTQAVGRRELGQARPTLPCALEPQLWERKYHLDFASVTEPAALERLPPEEQQDWATFWQEVDEVLRIGSR